MRRHHLTRRALVPLLGAGAIIACSAPTPVSPEISSNTLVAPTLRPGTVVGSYELSFFVVGAGGGLVPVSTLPVNTSELILGVHVADGFGVPADRGMVTFQYCSLKGLPPNDITRPDEAPSANCADGSATWANLGSSPVDESGSAFQFFGVVQIPRTVGFRCRYQSQGGVIASDICSPKDFTWTAAP